MFDDNAIETPTISKDDFTGVASGALRVDSSTADTFEVTMLNPTNSMTGETSMHFTLSDSYSEPVSYTIHWNIITNEPPSYSGDNPVSETYTAYFDDTIDIGTYVTDAQSGTWTIT